VTADWEMVAIGDLCDVVNGGTPKTGVCEYWDGPHLWITPAEMGKRASPYIDQTKRTITDQGLQNSSARLLPPFSVILSSRAPIGHLVINTESMATNQGCKGLVPSSRVDCKFLYYYLESIVDYLDSLGTGTTFKELSGGRLKEVLVPVPPIREQRRIVAILDKTFDDIANAKVNAQKNLQNAEDLISSYIRARMYENTKRWNQKNFEECIDDVRYTAKIKRKNFLDEGVYPIVSQENGLINGYWNKKNDVFQVKSPIIIFGDHTKILKYVDFDFVLGADGVKILAPKSFLFPKFFFYYLRSMPIESLGYARHFRILKQRNIFFPEKKEQMAIADLIDDMEVEAKSLCRLLELRIAALDELKRSILHKAFTGQL